LDLEEPVPSGADWFLPTLVVICGRTGAPIAPPELMEELDQARIENLLYRILDKTPPPDQLLIPQNPDWEEEDWRAFSAESKINIRFTPATKAISEELQAVTSLLVLRNGRPEQAMPAPRDVAAGLVRTALRLRSQSKKQALLRLALERDPDCSPARIELADVEGETTVVRHRHEELPHQFGVVGADPLGGDGQVVAEVGPAGAVERHLNQGLIQGSQEVAEPLDAAPVAEGLGQGLAEGDPHVLIGVVVVDVGVALGADLQVDQTVAADLVEHVIEEGHAGGQLLAAGAIEIDAHTDPGFGGIAADFGGSHGVG
jgi:hypothetical protein